jgi:hypothetical protein
MKKGCGGYAFKQKNQQSPENHPLFPIFTAG